MAREETESTGPGLLPVLFVLVWLGITAWVFCVPHPTVNTFNTVLIFGTGLVLAPLGTGTLGWVCGRHRRVAFAVIAYVVFALIYFMGQYVSMRIHYGWFPSLRAILRNKHWLNFALFGSYLVVFLLAAFVGRGVRTRRDRKREG